MSWHDKKKSSNNAIQVPINSLAWKHIDSKWPLFEREPCHLRLGIKNHNVNPFVLQDGPLD